ncbi:MAG: lysophospholipid acyltransferase family protein [Verrucomicrobiota bacterium]|nr:lysophospholipid acyltransferase family protein [Verrucomicrobiota bacterium]
MKLLYHLGHAVFGAMGRWYFHWKVLNPERVPAVGAAILASNHASYLDPPLIGSAIAREIHFLGRASLFRNRFAAAVLRAVNCVPVDREGGSPGGLKTVMQLLRHGNAVLLFPEGTRTPDGQLHPAEAGVGLLVLKCGCPVVPVGIWGMHEVYGRHMKFPKPGRVTISFGMPMDFSAVRARTQNCTKPELKEAYQFVADEVMRAIANLRPPTSEGAA